MSRTLRESLDDGMEELGSVVCDRLPSSPLEVGAELLLADGDDRDSS